jgi:hypothetical protein
MAFPFPDKFRQGSDFIMPGMHIYLNCGFHANVCFVVRAWLQAGFLHQMPG